MMHPVSSDASQPEPATPWTRGEWFAFAGLLIAVVSVLIAIAQGIYLIGFELQRVNDIERRVVTIESIQSARGQQMQQLAVDLARIDASMASLAEWAKEQREAARR
ncbi:hypothetical protein [Novosphingobium sp.]|uniref:hypothetical protein n=1 Tax=Novosphingobium sp. TaxID=1874826 RepID=UPI003D11838F